MPREPLFPHTPKRREPLFPHVPGGRQAERLPRTEEPDLKKLYQRGADGYPVGSDQVMRDAWGPIPNPDQPFWSGKGFVKPVKVYGWSFSPDHNQWRAYVRFPDGTETWTSPRSLSPQTRKHKPTKPARDDVEIGTWAERDRIGIWLNDKRTDKTIAEWWDEDAREMFDLGFFKPGDIRRQTISGRAFEGSVLDYAESVGIIADAGKLLPQTVRRPGESVEDWLERSIFEKYEKKVAEKYGVKGICFWTAVNKDTGEIVESFTPYTSSGRALRSGKIYAARHWKGSTALVEVWRQPHKYSENLKIQPVATERLVPTLSPQTSRDPVIEKGRDYYKVPPEAY